MLNNIRNLWSSSLLFSGYHRDLNKIILLALLTLLIVNIAAPIPAYAGQIDLPLDQALVLEGGESTNPRDYDPATTFSGAINESLAGWSHLVPN